MRKFATIPPSIWQTDIKKLRGNVEAIAVHYHLTTSPHSTMIGIYHLPMMYLSYEIGSPLEGASKGLQRVCEAGLATYDEESEIVWVHEMAATQVAPRLSPKDNRVSSVAKQLANFPICKITLDFYAHYRDLFHLRDQLCLEEFERAFQGANQAPSEPLRSKEKEQDKELGPETGKFGSGGKEDTYTRETENDEQEFPFEAPANLQEGKAFLLRQGLPDRYIEEALQRLMRECLYPCDIREWKREARDCA
ncbi:MULTISPECIES: hypothetical protein [unclassified Shinella]|uniref:hypothetical protein n=1 Tax=unclassified Shinella TaxID=2643062 RepID=UPI00225D4321|nr:MULTISPECIES: hypothetical protein [unclassified Shinella]MCO5137434.1 hypothetical protein [Shinella sp.]MDC7257388.1 hypothetical protein [Shinella sp. YE25]CAI0340278.1 conserved hypothetical protein [Rhizobiaceae bacterium]CAK7258652.1 conserved protein of unknown function [Shinella sp. WSC3-e]